MAMTMTEYVFGTIKEETLSDVAARAVREMPDIVRVMLKLNPREVLQLKRQVVLYKQWQAERQRIERLLQSRLRKGGRTGTMSDWPKPA